MYTSRSATAFFIFVIHPSFVPSIRLLLLLLFSDGYGDGFDG